MSASTHFPVSLRSCFNSSVNTVETPQKLPWPRHLQHKTVENRVNSHICLHLKRTHLKRTSSFTFALKGTGNTLSSAIWFVNNIDFTHIKRYIIKLSKWVERRYLCSCVTAMSVIMTRVLNKSHDRFEHSIGPILVKLNEQCLPPRRSRHVLEIAPVNMA